MATLNAEIEIKVICEECGEALDVDIYMTRDYRGNPEYSMEVKPCKSCIDEAFENGKADAESDE